MIPTSLRIDGVAVAIDDRAVLLRGPSGSGRSDLALRLIDEGAQLISDEQVELHREGDRLLVGVPAIMPTGLKGVIEARGVGLIAVPYVDRFIPLAWVIDMAGAAEIERMPAAETAEYLGVTAPLLKLDPFAVSATAKLRLAVRSGPGHILGRE
ncbi:MAG: serine/threonine protein kinase [Proteobacteria bacterium]|nr:serine/threonine protein kinase [Pseudomonadota bacterium]